METMILEKTGELKKRKEELEKKLNVEISIKGKQVTISGEAIEEYEASMIIDAISLGFSIKEALTIKNEETIFKKIRIKDFTKRKDLYEVKSRLIGTKGKTKRTLEEISGCRVVIGDSEVGIIGSAEDVESTVTAAANIIRGTKQANAYRYLERMNTLKKKF